MTKYFSTRRPVKFWKRVYKDSRRKTFVEALYLVIPSFVMTYLFGRSSAALLFFA